MRSAFSAVIAALVAAGLAGCSQSVSVKPIVIAAPNPAKQKPGKYAVYLGSFPNAVNIAPGQIWALSLTCQGISFDTDLRPVHETALRAALQSAFQQVDFVPAPLSPQEVHDKGYTAEFLFSVASVTGRATPSYGMVGEIKYGAQIEAIGSMSTIGSDGSRQTIGVSGMGIAATGFMLLCTQIGGALGDAAHDALTILVQRELDAARNSLATGAVKHS